MLQRARHSVPAQISVSLVYADSAEDVLPLVDRAINHIAQDFARTPKERQKRTEDGLTMDVVTSLSSMGFRASHDTNVGGHCDIVIEEIDNFLWLGEAKLHKSYPWLLEGFDQLDKRYATASQHQDHGGLIVYCYKGSTDRVLDKWATHLRTARPHVEVEDRASHASFFRSAHKHRRTGRAYHIRHVSIALQWQPDDES
jgi:hypothetical protein